MPYSFRPDLEKTREAIVYIANRSPNITFYYVLKMLYFAERRHLERYGRLIFGNRINAARQYGPVPEEAYTIIRDKRRVTDDPDFNVSGWTVIANRDADKDVFSESELSCLDEFLRLREMTFQRLMDVSHDEAYDAAQGIMTIEDFTRGMENRELILEHLENPFP